MSIFTKGEEVTRIVPPKVLSMISGVHHIESAHPRYRLTYEDGTTEEATLDQGFNNQDFLAIVSEVQSKRK